LSRFIFFDSSDPKINLLRLPAIRGKEDKYSPGFPIRWIA